jgi:hypothetical protein
MQDALQESFGGFDIFPPLEEGVKYHERYVQVDVYRHIKHQEIVDALGKAGLMDGEAAIGSGWRLARLKVIGTLPDGILLEDLSYRPN